MDGWARLGDRIFRERSRHWRTRPEFAHKTGLSVRTLVKIESGDGARCRETTFAAIEVALGWEPGSCLRIVGGRNPLRSTDPILARIQRVWPDVPVGVRAALARVAEESAERR